MYPSGPISVSAQAVAAGKVGQFKGLNIAMQAGAGATGYVTAKAYGGTSNSGVLLATVVCSAVANAFGFASFSPFEGVDFKDGIYVEIIKSGTPASVEVLPYYSLT